MSDVPDLRQTCNCGRGKGVGPHYFSMQEGCVPGHADAPKSDFAANLAAHAERMHAARLDADRQLARRSIAPVPDLPVADDEPDRVQRLGTLDDVLRVVVGNERWDASDVIYFAEWVMSGRHPYRDDTRAMFDGLNE